MTASRKALLRPQKKGLLRECDPCPPRTPTSMAAAPRDVGCDPCPPRTPVCAAVAARTSVRLPGLRASLPPVRLRQTQHRPPRRTATEQLLGCVYPEKRSIPGPPTPRPFKTEGWRRVERYSDRVTDCTAEPAAESSRTQAPRASSAGGAAAVCAEESGVSLFPRRRQHRRRRETALSLALVPTKPGV